MRRSGSTEPVALADRPTRPEPAERKAGSQQPTGGERQGYAWNLSFSSIGRPGLATFGASNPTRAARHRPIARAHQRLVLAVERGKLSFTLATMRSNAWRDVAKTTTLASSVDR